MTNPKVVIVDYGVGNLLSVQRAVEECGAEAITSSEPDVISRASRVILPGVGAFAKAMKALGVKKFHLGGGINSDEQNPLFRFKRKFSKSKYDFYIGKTIFNKEIYDLLCEDWVLMNPSKQEIYKKHLLKYKF